MPKFLPVSYADRPAFGPEEYLSQDEVDAIIEREEREAVSYAASHKALKYSPDQERDDHGRFAGGGSTAGAEPPTSRFGGEVIWSADTGWADSEAGTLVPEVSRTQESSTLNAGTPLPEGSPLAQAIEARTGGGDYGPEQHALIVAAIQEAKSDAPELYRGFPLSTDAGWTPEESAAFTDSLTEGTTLELKLGSWTEDEAVSREFAALDEKGNPVQATDERAYTPTGNFITPEQDRVVFTAAPGAQALNLAPNAAERFQYQAEWATTGTFRINDVSLHDGVWDVAVTQLDSIEPGTGAGNDYTERLTDEAVRAMVEGMHP